MVKREISREPLDTTTEIETPEHVRFRYHVAGPGKRAMAYLIDLVVRAAVVTAAGFIAALAGVASGESFGQASMGLLLFIFFWVEWGYYVFFETLWSGRTPGKRALHLRVVTEGGHPLRFLDSVLRNLLRAADLLPPIWAIGSYGIGLVVMARDPRFRRLGDLAAGTLVINEERQAVGAALRLDPPPTTAELRGIPQRVPLRGEELDAIELFLRRRGKLSAAREDELAQMVAPVFAKRLGVKYKDATRFLGLLHHRARGQEVVSAPPPILRGKKRRG
jgi:uncharacterized RDD family membrane protein YckC